MKRKEALKVAETDTFTLRTFMGKKESFVGGLLWSRLGNNTTRLTL
ncbi:hypothetical protein [Paraclostridium bifermentans]|nr:hypothetical protein [Paraclostridium bifermentans]